MTRTSPDCPDCGTSTASQPHYDHVHWVTELPRARHSDSHVVVHGYAVGFGGSGGLPWTMVFFADLEPAIVFGRAARMSAYDISTYDVSEAAREQRYDEFLHRDVVTLYLKAGSELRDHPNERPILERWVRGCHPNSAYYEGRS